jgi:membrane-associated phospholipid phosphatase
MDLALFRTLNALAGQGFDSVILFCDVYLPYILIALFAGASLWPVRNLKLLATGLGAAVVARFGLKSLLVLVVERARPFVALPDVHLVITPDIGEDLQSMPSGHALFFFALAMVAYRYNRHLGIGLYVGATVMGITRIIGGVHWPSDILVGALLGSLVGWLIVHYTTPSPRAA